MAARFAFTDPNTLISETDLEEAADDFDSGIDFEVFYENTGEECDIDYALLDINSRGFSILITEDEDGGERRRRLHSDHVHIEEEVPDCFKDLDKLRLVVEVSSDQDFWITEEGGELMRNDYIFHLKEEPRTKEFEECKNYGAHSGKLVDLFEEDVVTMFPGSQYTIKMKDDYRKSMCSRLYDYSVTDTASSRSTYASIDFDAYEITIFVGESESADSWFYVEVDIDAFGNLDERYSQLRVRVMSEHEPNWILPIETIEVLQYSSYENYEFPQLTQEGTFEIVSFSELGSSRTEYCENEYTALKIKNKKVSLINAHELGTYSVYVQVKGHNGVIKNGLTELRFRVVENEIKYNISMIQPEDTTIDINGDGSFEVSFNNTYEFMTFSEAFPWFLGAFDLSYSYSAITEFTSNGFKGKVYYVAKSKTATLKITNYQSDQVINRDDPDNIMGLEQSSVSIKTTKATASSLSRTQSGCLLTLIGNLYRGNS